MMASSSATTVTTVDVETGTTTTPPTSLPTLKAPTTEPLKDAESIYDYVSEDINQKHLSFDFRIASPTVMAYYNAFTYVVPMADDTTEEAEEALMETLQNDYTARPHHYTTSEQ